MYSRVQYGSLILLGNEKGNEKEKKNNKNGNSEDY